MTKRRNALPAASRRQVLKTAAFAGAAAMAPSLLTVAARAAGHMAKVNMQLGWLASNGLIGEVVGLAKGYYEEAGVELEITPGGPGVDGVASVAAGRAGVGQLSSSPSLMLARSAGIPVKAFAAGYQKHPFTYFSLAEQPDPVAAGHDRQAPSPPNRRRRFCCAPCWPRTASPRTRSRSSIWAAT